jgi:hypothetical protein
VNYADVIEELAGLIRHRYCDEYRRYEDKFNARTGSTYGSRPLPQWDGGTTNYGRRCRPIWPKIANFFLQHGIDYQLLIREYFNRRIGGVPPAPTFFLSDKAVALHAVAAKRQLADMILSARTENELAKTRFWCSKMEHEGVPDDVLWKRVALDPSADLSPLFRYCLAHRVGALDVAALYKKRAFWQYLRSPRLHDEAMGPVIPKELRDEATRVVLSAR